MNPTCLANYLKTDVLADNPRILKVSIGSGLKY
jgi:hypothetical protein